MTAAARSPLSNEKPSAVATAIKLSYLALIIGIPRSFLEWSHVTQAASPGFALFVILFTFGLIVCLVHQTDRGRNWARITLLCLTILGVPMSIRPLLHSLAYSPVSGVLGLAQAALQIVALIMLFSRGARRWFRPAAISEQPAMLT